MLFATLSLSSISAPFLTTWKAVHYIPYPVDEPSVLTHFLMLDFSQDLAIPTNGSGPNIHEGAPKDTSLLAISLNTSNSDACQYPE